MSHRIRARFGLPASRSAAGGGLLLLRSRTHGGATFTLPTVLSHLASLAPHQPFEIALPGHVGGSGDSEGNGGSGVSYAGAYGGQPRGGAYGQGTYS